MKLASTSSLTETSSMCAPDVKSDDEKLRIDASQLHLFRHDSSVKKKSKFVAVWS